MLQIYFISDVQKLCGPWSKKRDKAGLSLLLCSRVCVLRNVCGTALVAVLVFRVKPLYIKYSINIYITFIYFNPHSIL